MRQYTIQTERGFLALQGGSCFREEEHLDIISLKGADKQKRKKTGSGSIMLLKSKI